MTHRTQLRIFIAIVLLHWVEHIAQIGQIHQLHWERKHAMGVLGYFWPSLMRSEWLHFGYAVVMMFALMWLYRGFSEQGRTWWGVAAIIQAWHLFEHFLLFVQAQGGFTLFGALVPTSVVQMAFPQMKAELHLFYNSIVTIPMVIAMIYHFLSQAKLQPNVSFQHG